MLCPLWGGNKENVLKSSIRPIEHLTRVWKCSVSDAWGFSCRDAYRAGCRWELWISGLLLRPCLLCKHSLTFLKGLLRPTSPLPPPLPPACPCWCSTPPPPRYLTLLTVSIICMMVWLHNLQLHKAWMGIQSHRNGKPLNHKGRQQEEDIEIELPSQKTDDPP